MSISYDEYNRGRANGTIPPEPIPAIEQHKYDLTRMAERARAEGNYKEVCRLKRELASICRNQGKYDDAYKLMHDAFLYEQMWIYQQANVPTRAFSKLPYAEKLKEALSEAAEWAEIMGQTAYAVSFRLLNARICRAQGMERDAYLLDNASYSLLEKAGRASDWKRFPNAVIEEECLKQIARKYGTKLSEDKPVR